MYLIFIFNEFVDMKLRRYIVENMFYIKGDCIIYFWFYIMCCSYGNDRVQGYIQFDQIMGYVKKLL